MSHARDRLLKNEVTLELMLGHALII